MKEKNNFMLIMIVVLSVSLLGAISYIIYDKAANNSEGSTNKTNNQVKNSSQTAENNDISINKEANSQSNTAYVVEQYNKRVNFTVSKSVQTSEYDKYSVTVNEAILPKININTDNAKKFNDKIINDYKTITDMIDRGSASSSMEADTSHRINYDYFVNGNIIFIMITDKVYTYHGSGFEDIKGYYYDIVNDKELTVKEICSKYGITIEDVNSNYQYYMDNSMVKNKESISNIDEVLVVMQSNNLKVFSVYFEKGPSLIYATVFKQ